MHSLSCTPHAAQQCIVVILDVDETAFDVEKTVVALKALVAHTSRVQTLARGGLGERHQDRSTGCSAGNAAARITAASPAFYAVAQRLTTTLKEERDVLRSRFGPRYDQLAGDRFRSRRRYPCRRAARVCATLSAAGLGRARSD